ncbi:hypothetical protein BC834DRAFT_612087 [Gloeopeniophorella convolvens]|nr:hypothetical protein BC834DRAFT_612087 [Gloeopeniophorella convolvens]
MASDQLALAPLGQPVSHSLGSAFRPGDPHGRPPHRSHLRLRIIHADGLHVTGFLDRFKHRRFYVTATDGVTTETTKAIKSEKHLARWDEIFNNLTTDSSSRLTLRLFATRDKHDDALLGELDLPYPELVRSLAPRDFHLVPITRSPKQSHQVTLRLEITIDHSEPHSQPALSSRASEPSSVPGKVVDGPARSPSSTPSAAGTVPGTPSLAEMLDRVALPAVDDAAGQLAAPSAPVASMANYAEQASGALDQAGGIYDTWNVILTRMKWVVDCTEKIAEIHPYAKIAWSILSLIPKMIFAQVERDENVKALVLAIHDALDLARDASAFESSIQDSAQRDILMAMLTHACDCGEFIHTYAKDTQFWKRLWKNTGHEVDTRIQGHCSKLVALRDGFLRHATVTIEKTTFQIRDVVSGVSVQIDRMSSRLDGISGQLESVLGEVADAGIDSVIREIPYALGASFNSDRGCLTGTRDAFLDHVTSWVNNPDSTRGLVLFGRAGTGKSSIAHEVARRFRKMDRLTSSFIFLRGQRSSREPHLFFTGLARDLSDRYPAFRVSLGKCIQHDTYARIGATNYTALFENMLLQPLANIVLVGPVLVVVDALDEAADATGEDDGLCPFLAKRVRELPSNFRIFITSRTEHEIEQAFVDADAINIVHMDDQRLSADTNDDIRAYLSANLSPHVYSEHGKDLARKAESLFQWAAAACRYINTRRRGLTEDDCVSRILNPTSGRPQRMDPLDKLYLTILESGFDLSDPVVKRRYQSVMGQLLSRC